ncbi:MAG: DNA-binding domain-containing protein [Hyphomicrobium sp.]
MKLADLQAQFQASILGGGDDVLPLIPDSPREKKEVLFGVYRDAYVLRLLGILQEDFAHLQTYIGDDAFDALARAYIAATPSHTPNARYYGQTFPGFVAAYDAFKHTPAVTALARLHGALNDVFDCADAEPLSLAALAQFAPDDFDRLTVASHPSVRRIDTFVNVDELWSALAKEETPPAPVLSVTHHALIVWRKDVTPHFRSLPPEEAMAWDEMAKGVRFGVLCEMLATFDDPDNAALRAAQYLQTWISNGMLSAAALAPRRPSRKKSPPTSPV